VTEQVADLDPPGQSRRRHHDRRLSPHRRSSPSPPAMRCHAKGGRSRALEGTATQQPPVAPGAGASRSSVAPRKSAFATTGRSCSERGDAARNGWRTCLDLPTGQAKPLPARFCGEFVPVSGRADPEDGSEVTSACAGRPRRRQAVSCQDRELIDQRATRRAARTNRPIGRTSSRSSGPPTPPGARSSTNDRAPPSPARFQWPRWPLPREGARR
jgi:hypothetical protein